MGWFGVVRLEVTGTVPKQQNVGSCKLEFSAAKDLDEIRPDITPNGVPNIDAAG